MDPDNKLKTVIVSSNNTMNLVAKWTCLLAQWGCFTLRAYLLQKCLRFIITN